MNFIFVDTDLEDVYYDPSKTLGHGYLLDRSFRKVIGSIKAADSEIDLRNLKSLHYHKLEGKLKNQHALDLYDQWRLIVEREVKDSQTKLLIIAVENYH